MRETVPMLRTVVAMAIVAAATAVGCGGAGEPQRTRERVRVATGNDGGVYDAYGRGIVAAVERHLPGRRPSALTTDGSLENLRRLAAGDVDVAFTLADSAAAAKSGSEVFPAPVPVVALARLYDNYVQLVVTVGSDIDELADLRGRRVGVGSRGSGTRLVAERILAVARLGARSAVRRAALDITPAADALADGTLDALFWSGGLPTRAISDLRGRVGVRLVDLSGVAAELREAHGDLYSEARVPRSAYGLASVVQTVSVPNYLVVSRRMSDALANDLTRLLFEHRAELERAHPEARRLDVRAAISTYPLDLHAGAKRYYRDAGR